MVDPASAVGVILAEKRLHLFTADLSGTCECGYQAQTVVDWDDHVARAQISALATWMDAFSSPLVVNEIGELASTWATRHLRGGD